MNKRRNAAAGLFRALRKCAMCKMFVDFVGTMFYKVCVDRFPALPIPWETRPPQKEG